MDWGKQLVFESFSSQFDGRIIADLSHVFYEKADTEGSGWIKDKNINRTDIEENYTDMKIKNLGGSNLAAVVVIVGHPAWNWLFSYVNLLVIVAYMSFG